MISEKMVSYVQGSSAIRAMFEEGKRLSAIYGAENVYDFSLGNPNLPAPKEVKEAVYRILEEEDSVFVHGYMSNSGYEDVRGAVAESLNRRFGTAFHGENIVMTVGAAGGMNVIMKTLLNPGEEVVVFAPYFGEYRAYVTNYDGVLVTVPPNTEDFQPDLAEFEKRITPKTKAVIVNTPNNPTGVIYSEEIVDITEVRLRLVKDPDKLKAVASITIDGCFGVHDLRVVENDDTLFVAMPNKRLGTGEFRDVAHPINNETRDAIANIVIGKYKEELAKSQAKTAD